MSLLHDGTQLERWTTMRHTMQPVVTMTDNAHLRDGVVYSGRTFKTRQRRGRKPRITEHILQELRRQYHNDHLFSAIIQELQQTRRGRRQLRQAVHMWETFGVCIL